MRKVFGLLILYAMLLSCSCKKEPTKPLPEPVPAKPGCEIHVLSLGKADSILIVADGEAMLIDAGYEQQGDIILSYLKEQGISKLKYVVLTHGDKDHVGGMAEILRNIETEQVFLSPRKENSKEYSAMIGVLSSKSIPYSVPELESTFTLGKGSFTVLAPGKKALKEDTDNDSSIVLRLRYGERSALFMGDALTKTEKEMRDEEYELSADILKIGHHGKGDATSKKFLSAVAPMYAVITCGEIIDDTEDGVPDEEVLRRLSSFSVKTYRTDTDGTIVFRTEGETWQVQKEQ